MEHWRCDRFDVQYRLDSSIAPFEATLRASPHTSGSQCGTLQSRHFVSVSPPCCPYPNVSLPICDIAPYGPQCT